MLYIHKSWLVLGNSACVRPSMLPSEINARVENSFGAMFFVRICAHFMPEAFWCSHWALGRDFLYGYSDPSGSDT